MDQSKSSSNGKISVGDSLLTKEPTLQVFLKEAGFKNKYVPNLAAKLRSNGINDVTDIYSMSKHEIEDLEGFKGGHAIKIYQHAAKLRNKHAILMTSSELKRIEKSYRYLRTPSSGLEKILTYSNGKSGLRSQTLIEVYGKASVGKTQFCLTAAALCMRPKSQGGLGKGVIYIDSEGAFEYSRFVYMAKYWGVAEEFVDENLIVSKVHSFDDVEYAIKEAVKIIKEKEIGLIVVDSIMDPLKSSYQISGDDLSNLQPRQAHLKKVTDLLKTIAQQHNLVALYTNHVRTSFDEDKGTVAQGGNVLSHASDIRIELKLLDTEVLKIEKKLESQMKDLGVKIAVATVVDSGFLPMRSGRYLIGPMGIGPDDEIEMMVEHSKMINKKGYICINSRGEPIDPIIEEHKKGEAGIGRLKNELYG